MLEQIKFVNHLNESMDWGKNRIFVQYNDLRDYAWDYSADNDRIAFFTQGVVTKTVPLLICCTSEEDGVALKNQIFELAEKDVLSVKHGKLILGDYYLRCFITGSDKTNYLYRKGYLETSLKITTDYPQWVKETTVSFLINGSDSGETGYNKRNFDYNFDFPFDYSSGMIGKTLNNTGFVSSNFRLIIYGAVSNPAIHIAGHTYQVNYTIEDNEYLIVDSVQKTITLIQRNGTVINCFNYRNRDSYIFEKIPVGNNSVTWNGLFGFEVILIDERSEPKWT